MPLYYFHVRHGHGFVEDQEGIELPNVFAAYSEAVRSAVEFLAEVSDQDPMQLEVSDAAGVLVLSASIHGLAAAWQKAAGYSAQVLPGRLLH